MRQEFMLKCHCDAPPGKKAACSPALQQLTSLVLLP
jgi:hypothetical protein